MKAFSMHGIGGLRLADLARPVPGPGAVLLRPPYTGVCSTELHVLYANAFAFELPITLRHEFRDEVEALGPGIPWRDPYPQSRPLQPGTRVCVEPVLPCMQCYYCVRGQVNICQSMLHIGIRQDRSLAELVRVPASRCTHVPDELTDQAGALAEVLVSDKFCRDGCDKARRCGGGRWWPHGADGGEGCADQRGGDPHYERTQPPCTALRRCMK